MLSKAKTLLESIKSWLRTALPYHNGVAPNSHPIYKLFLYILTELEEIREILSPTTTKIEINGKEFTIYERDRELFEGLINTLELEKAIYAYDGNISELKEKCSELEKRLHEQEARLDSALLEVLQLMSEDT